MSKSRALAGLWVGYAIGDAGLVAALMRVKDSFNSYPLGRLAQAGAIASLEDEAHFQQARLAVMRNRVLLITALIRLGFDLLPSLGLHQHGASLWPRSQGRKTARGRPVRPFASNPN